VKQGVFIQSALIAFPVPGQLNNPLCKYLPHGFGVTARSKADRLQQSFFELHFGFPSEQLLRSADIWLPLVGVIKGKRLMNDLR
jgi:hypothetical protein